MKRILAIPHLSLFELHDLPQAGAEPGRAGGAAPVL